MTELIRQIEVEYAKAYEDVCETTTKICNNFGKKFDILLWMEYQKRTTKWLTISDLMLKILSAQL